MSVSVKTKHCSGKPGRPPDLPREGLCIPANEDGRSSPVPLFQVPVGARPPRKVPYDSHPSDEPRSPSIRHQEMSLSPFLRRSTVEQSCFKMSLCGKIDHCAHIGKMR